MFPSPVASAKMPTQCQGVEVYNHSSLCIHGVVLSLPLSPLAKTVVISMIFFLGETAASGCGFSTIREITLPPLQRVLVVWDHSLKIGMELVSETSEILHIRT
jgi:hypothetical protein